MSEPSAVAAGTGGADVPRIVAEVRDDGTGYLTVDGVREDIVGDDMSEVGARITGRIADLAGSLGLPLPAEVRDPDGLWMLLIHPDGRVDEAPPAIVDHPPNHQQRAATDPSARTGPRAHAGPAGGSSAPSPSPAPARGPSFPTTAPAATSFPARAGRGPATTAAAPAGAAGPRDASREALGEMLATRRGATRTAPATRGLRLGLRRATFGLLRPGPGRAERAQRAAVDAVRRPLDGPRTIVVVNPKGGAHKTTATLLLAAAFGLERGGYTLAWDNNETHGTLGWRSSAPDAGRTALDLLRALPELGRRGEIRVGDLDEFVRTQVTEQFDVLASDDNAASGATVDAQSFAALHQVLTRFYRVVVVDTGNNIRSSNWRAAVDAADQLVIVSTIREDTAQSASWAVDALRAAGRGDAVAKAVTILSAPDPKVDKDLRKRLRQHFGQITRAVVEVPYDQALVAGGPIEYARLERSTRDAWLHATAAVADGL